MAIKNRYEFLFYVECVNGNPNGDPDMGNMPRQDAQDLCGYITDVALKRRIRNYIQDAYENEDGMEIIMQNATNINRKIAKAKIDAGVELSAKDKNSVYKSRQEACRQFYDVRTFGGVLSTGPNAGQVRGPVQLTFAKSLDPVQSNDISITRMCVTEDKGLTTYQDYLNYEEKTPEDKLRTMGRKQFIPYGLYEARGFISANLAQETGFDDTDLTRFFEAILNMYEHDRSASKGQMTVISPVIVFKHVGTDSCEEQRKRQQRLGCASAQQLFKIIETKKNEGIEYPRKIEDYTIDVDLSKLPAGVEIGFKTMPYEEIQWGTLTNAPSYFNIHG